VTRATLLTLLAVLAAPAVAGAQSKPESAEEKFRSLPAEKQDELRRRYRELQQLAPEERQRIEQNLDRLKQMPPDERGRVEENYRRFRGRSSALCPRSSASSCATRCGG